MAALFEPLTVRNLTLRNRVAVSPMVQTSSVDGFASDWHLVHLGSRASGGAGLVVTEATAVEPQGRISIFDLGLWSDAHVPMLRRIANFIESEGAVPAIQLAHGGRKSSYRPPYDRNGIRPLEHLKTEEGAWKVLGPSTIPFDAESPIPTEMTVRDISRVIDAFQSAAERAVTAGFRWIEVHAAHGYLPHAFYSPLSNIRKDSYGGGFENRVKFSREIARAIRSTIPDNIVLAFRLSYTDWTEGGWTLAEAARLAVDLKSDGVDFIDVSSGGNSPYTVALMQELRASTKDPQSNNAVIPLYPGYQVEGAAYIKKESGLPVSTVGLITDPSHAESILCNDQADIIMLAREMLRDPNWPIRAAIALEQTEKVRIPVQYHLAWKGYGDFHYNPVSAPLLDDTGDVEEQEAQ